MSRYASYTPAGASSWLVDDAIRFVGEKLAIRYGLTDAVIVGQAFWNLVARGVRREHRNFAKALSAEYERIANGHDPDRDLSRLEALKAYLEKDAAHAGFALEELTAPFPRGRYTNETLTRRTAAIKVVVGALNEGWNQADVAKVSGWTRDQVSRLVNAAPTDGTKSYYGRTLDDIDRCLRGLPVERATQIEEIRLPASGLKLVGPRPREYSSPRQDGRGKTVCMACRHVVYEGSDFAAGRQRLKEHRERCPNATPEHPEEERGMSAAAPTAVERIAWLEERVRELDRQLGLVDDKSAEEAVDRFLEDAQREEGS